MIMNMKNFENENILIYKDKIFFLFFIICMSILCSFSIFLFKPIIDSDGTTYVETIKVLQRETELVGFFPNRLLTSFLGIESVIFFSKIFGSIEFGWLMLNITFFFLIGIFFYKLVMGIFQSARTAFLASLFLTANYSIILFGLDYWMDTGGWFFYLLSIYFTFNYVKTSEKKLLLYSAVAVGIGGMFKEYAFLAVVPIVMIIIYENWFKPFLIVKKSTFFMLISFAPASAVGFWVYWKFGYTYAMWFSYSREYYVYFSRISEYVKSLGSLYTTLSFVVIGGAYCSVVYRKEIFSGNKLQFYVFSLAISILPIFIWSAITQRILFITVFPAIIIACAMFKKYDKRWYLFLPLLITYIVASFTMSDFILPNINLPI